MTQNQVKAIANFHQIKTSGLSKLTMIHAIQKNEGNFDCYATACKGECDQMGCMWREDCFDDAPFSKVCM